MLLDEIEKAHPDVFNILLQVLDDGRLTDNKGRTVDFRNTIIIMTSNMGSHIIQERFSKSLESHQGIDEQIMESVRADVVELLKQQLKPEFLNRIDEIVLFEPLTEGDIEKIVDMQMHNLAKLLGNNGISLNYSTEVRKYLATIGYDALYGARPVKRTIQREIVGELSKRILAGEVDRSMPITITMENDLLHFAN